MPEQMPPSAGGAARGDAVPFGRSMTSPRFGRWPGGGAPRSARRHAARCSPLPCPSRDSAREGKRQSYLGAVEFCHHPSHRLPSNLRPQTSAASYFLHGTLPQPAQAVSSMRTGRRGLFDSVQSELRLGAVLPGVVLSRGAAAAGEHRPAPGSLVYHPPRRTRAPRSRPLGEAHPRFSIEGCSAAGVWVFVRLAVAL